MSLRLAFYIAVGLGMFTPLAATPMADRQGPEYPHMGPDIFDRRADAEQLIACATTQATREQKPVLLLLGANWCPWCRRLHQAITTNPRIVALLKERFVLVYVDVNIRNDRKRNAATLARLGDPVAKHGLPVLVVLKADGALFATHETGSLAAPTDDELARRLLALLHSWSVQYDHGVVPATVNR